MSPLFDCHEEQPRATCSPRRAPPLQLDDVRCVIAARESFFLEGYLSYERCVPFTCCARGRPIIVEWERDARHSAGLSLVRNSTGSARLAAGGGARGARTTYCNLSKVVGVGGRRRRRHAPARTLIAPDPATPPAAVIVSAGPDRINLSADVRPDDFIAKSGRGVAPAPPRYCTLFVDLNPCDEPLL
ncbi:hypothetical protein EVAR_35329_1 [Eumeta japonica]|uniref:Uncharacterized protein n=1 Tax=Eumeta variegata TaxID=151549 RepID=A0A4C1XMC9_EUMVA|nr:hypothetical protein EVAR_35329_1 [Eumeta japonica]